MFHDPRVNRYLPPSRLTESGAQYVAFAQRSYRAGAGYRFAARDRATRQFAGAISLFDLHPEDRWAELGYALPAARWGQGYATEAVSAVLAWAFSSLGLHRVGAWVVEPNRSSVAVLRRMGFRREGRSREAAARRGGYDDLLQFGLLASEFRPRGRPRGQGARRQVRT